MLDQDFFNDELLKKRVDVFYGYGNYKGNYWFIGMEERGEDFQDINKRINIWSNRGKYEIDDVAEYHIDMGTWDERIQPTWNKLIRIVLSAKGTGNIDIEDVRKYQINELARKDKETCLLELLPLPSPSLKHWIYGEYSKLTFLSNRDTYENYCLEKRINYISQRIKEYQPKAVVFYGIGCEYSWRRITEKITDVEFSPTSEGFLICRNSQTVFVIAKHPVARGVTSEYFHNIGKSIAAKIAEK
ncbi:hypothetical protein [Nostoc sp. JL33]|uniref:hypothetical protein n=1 Tax=Nostoc sp. JL33 TaxID=2815396 RepID=UPI0025E1020D|nr:hypothetical protein [Nostoc sp. JL33]MBN3870541.1 hypothetical protein [Nostoc sp. JL33]